MSHFAHAARHSLLRGVAIAALAQIAAPALAGSSSWSATPANGDWNRAGNWLPTAVPNAPADIATLGATSVPAMAISANTSVNSIVFAAGAPVYTISAPEALTLTIGGSGLTNNSGVVQQFVSAPGRTVTNVNQGGYLYPTSTPGGTIAFVNAASAGANVLFTNLGVVNIANFYVGTTTFANSSSAATASFVNAGSAVANGGGGRTIFTDTATAASATFTNNGNTVSKGSYAYGNNGGETEFRGSSTAATATITNNSGTVSGAEGGQTYFDDTATAGNANVTNNGAIATGAQAGLTAFNRTSTAGAATIVNNGNTATGGVGGGTLRQGFTYGGATAFYDNSTAGTASITNNASTVIGAYGGGVSVGDNATAANATITNNGSSVSGAFGGATVFIGSGTAGNATLIANGGTNGGGGGAIVFSETTSGGTATIKVFGNGALDISAHDRTRTDYVFTNNSYTTVTTPLPTPLVTIGSLEGTGVVLLGANSLAIGSNNASTAFSGTIANGGLFGGSGGSLTKIGTGALTLSGGNAYTGGTTVSAGTLQIGSGGTSGSILGNIVDNGALIFNRSDASTFAGVISGTGSVAMQGTGTLTLSGVNSYAGATTIASGTLRTGAVGALPTATSVTVAAGASLDLNNLSQSLASLAGAGTVQLGSATLTTGSSNASTTFSGAIAGTGALTKVGTGTLTLSGTNSYSGGTTIGAGSVIASASGLGTGAVTDNAALVVNQTVDGSFGAAINGTGTLTKQGASAFNYTGTGTLSGATTVSAGLFAVNGSLRNSVVTLQTGTTLGGNGTIGGIVALGGSTVAPGNSVGQLNAAGNVSFASGTTYRVEIDAAGNNDRIVATGSATLSGGAVQVTGAPASLGATTTTLKLVPDATGRGGSLQTLASAAPARFTILTAAGGLTGSFASVASDATNLTASLSYDASNAYLTLTPAAVAAQTLLLTRNQFATGQALLALPATSALYLAVKGLTVGGAAQAFDAASGEIHASAITSDFAVASVVQGAVLDRLGADMGDAKHGAWLRGFGNFGVTRTDGNAARLSRRTGGFIIGADATIGGGVLLGVAGGYLRTTLNVPARLSTGSAEGVFGTVYLAASAGLLRIRAGASYADNRHAVTRGVQFTGFNESDQSRYGGSTLQGFAEIGYQLGSDDARVEPFVGAAALRVRASGFRESGGAAALAAPDRSYRFETVSAGIKANLRLASMIGLRGLVGYRRSFESLTPEAALAFVAGGSAFAVVGVPIDRDTGLAEVALTAQIARNVSFAASYHGQYGKRGQDHSANATLTWSF